MTDHDEAEDCSGVPVKAEVFDTYPPAYIYRCSVCNKIMPTPPKPPTEQKPADLTLRHLGK